MRYSMFLGFKSSFSSFKKETLYPIIDQRSNVIASIPISTFSEEFEDEDVPIKVPHNQNLIANEVKVGRDNLSFTINT